MDNNLIHPLEKTEGKIKLGSFFILVTLITILGTLTGFFLSRLNQTKTNQIVETNNKKVVGIIDKKTFKDSAEGVLKEGGIDGEGNFHLERPGGQSQNVYLTSSTVDLSEFIGKKIKVYGQTFAGEKAGWLMDVGYVEILK